MPTQKVHPSDLPFDRPRSIPVGYYVCLAIVTLAGGIFAFLATFHLHGGGNQVATAAIHE